MTKKTPNQTREEWLHAVSEKMAPAFAHHGHPIPDRVRFRSVDITSALRLAIGHTSRGPRGADESFEIFIDPRSDDPVIVASILTHELIHAAVGLKAGHNGAFKDLALTLGLAGKMTATVPGQKFEAWIGPIIEAVGPLPHARLIPGSPNSLPKKQKARLIKASCPECGYDVRVTAKWIDEVGPPRCGDLDHGELEVEGAQTNE